MRKRSDLEIVEIAILEIKSGIEKNKMRQRFTKPRAIMATAEGKETMIFTSIQRAGKAKNEKGKKFYVSAIHRACNGALKTHGGYKWEFLEEDEDELDKDWRKRYEKRSINRKDFKILCEKNEGKIEDFEETFSGEKAGSNKKYYYRETSND